MGYHSNVVLILSKEAKELLHAKVDVLPQEAQEKIIRVFSHADKHFVHESGAELFHWSWGKWYRNYPEIDFIERFLDELEDRDKEFGFMRIGEDLGDIEQKGYYLNDPFKSYIEVDIKYDTPNCIRITHE